MKVVWTQKRQQPAKCPVSHACGARRSTGDITARHETRVNNPPSCSTTGPGAGNSGLFLLLSISLLFAAQHNVDGGEDLHVQPICPAAHVMPLPQDGCSPSSMLQWQHPSSPRMLSYPGHVLHSVASEGHLDGVLRLRLHTDVLNVRGTGQDKWGSIRQENENRSKFHAEDNTLVIWPINPEIIELTLPQLHRYRSDDSWRLPGNTKIIETSRLVLYTARPILISVATGGAVPAVQVQAPRKVRRAEPQELVVLTGRGNGRSQRKPAGQQHVWARFPHAKIRSDSAGDWTRIALVRGYEEKFDRQNPFPQSDLNFNFLNVTCNQLPQKGKEKEEDDDDDDNNNNKQLHSIATVMKESGFSAQLRRVVPGDDVQSLASSAEVPRPQAVHGIIKQHQYSGEKSPSTKKSRMSILFSPMRSHGEKSRTTNERARPELVETKPLREFLEEAQLTIVRYFGVKKTQPTPLWAEVSLSCLLPGIACIFHYSGILNPKHLSDVELGSDGTVARALASHHGDRDSIPGRFTPGFSHVGIVLDDAACQLVFSGYSLFSPLAFQHQSIIIIVATTPPPKAPFTTQARAAMCLCPLLPLFITHRCCRVIILPSPLFPWQRPANYELGAVKGRAHHLIAWLGLASNKVAAGDSNSGVLIAAGCSSTSSSLPPNQRGEGLSWGAVMRCDGLLSGGTAPALTTWVALNWRVVCAGEVLGCGSGVLVEL
ncbi:hypothetical protein PR048_030099 [Dryococelus australis]|uniref:Uncharacterized protein n=1 Tax=Dryococelus australis TaxID=614101 RepID=A0ABQ9GBW6_9NEOP|nr:hypothetical protein PR048_030099 [Dryococelus australis]